MARTVPIGASGIDPYMGKTNYIRIVLAAAETTKDSPKISMNTGVHQGQMVGWKCKANDNTNNVTYTLRMVDRDGDVIYTSAGGHPENAVTVVMGLNVPLVEKEIIRITASGAPGASTGIYDVTLYYNPDADIIAWGYR